MFQSLPQIVSSEKPPHKRAVTIEKRETTSNASKPSAFKRRALQIQGVESRNRERFNEDVKETTKEIKQQVSLNPRLNA
jgi:hypothetical protein